MSSLREYQDKGVDWIVRQLKIHRAVLLADEMGLGKSAQALKAAEKLKTDNLLIICPAGARRVWDHEIRRWVPSWTQRLVLVEPGMNTARAQTRLIDRDKPIVMVIGYDEFSNTRSHFAAELRRRRWNLLIIDEAHFLKNPSNRTMAIYGPANKVDSTHEGVQSAADKVLLLTGTPAPNHAGEMYQHYRALWPDMLRRRMTLPQFEEAFTRYKDTPFGRQVVGSKNQKVLREALAPYVLRRRKDQVLPELPPLILQDVALARTPVAYSVKAGTAPSRLQLAGDGDDALLAALRRPDDALATLRRELGEAKVKPTIAWVQERLESTQKIVLFAWHHSVIAHLAHGLAEFSPVGITGETSPAARTKAIEAFQTQPYVRVFLGQVLAAGTAITLTAANEVAVVEPSWVPGENVQAICRAHRLGQRDSVLASFLYLPGTLDERIMGTFRRKAGEIAVLQGEAA